MKQRPFQLSGQPVRVTRTLPKSCPLYDRSVTGLKIKIHGSDSVHTSVDKPNDNDLMKYFQRFGKIRRCQWTDVDRTEALFIFAE
jgi:hypothetical protein